MLRRLLLRFLLRRSLAARDEASHFHLDDERLLVIRTDFADDVVIRQREPASLRQLLQRGLVVMEDQTALVDRLDVVSKCLLDLAPRSVDPAVEIHGATDAARRMIEQ